MRHEAVGRHTRYESRSDAPGRVGIDRERGGSQLFHQVEHHLFVLLEVVGAGAVNEHSARLEGRPHVGEDLPLAFGAAVHPGRRPLGNGVGVFAKHPLARAGHIGSHHVEVALETGKVGRLVAGHHREGRAPFRQVLGQDIGAVGHHLVAHHQTAGRERGDGIGRFSAGCGAKVEVAHRGVYVLVDDPMQEHRGCLLHIVGPGMEAGVEGEGRPFGQIVALLRPGYRFAQRSARPAFGRVEPDAHRRLGSERLFKAGVVVAQQAAGAVDKRRGQFCHNRVEEIFTIRQR